MRVCVCVCGLVLACLRACVHACLACLCVRAYTHTHSLTKYSARPLFVQPPLCARHGRCHLQAAADVFGANIVTWEATPEGLRTHTFVSASGAGSLARNRLVLLCALGQHFWCASEMGEEELAQFSAARVLEETDLFEDSMPEGEGRAAGGGEAEMQDDGGAQTLGGGTSVVPQGVSGRERELQGGWEGGQGHRSPELASGGSSEESNECDRGDSIFAEFGLTPDDAGWLEGLDTMLGGIENWGPNGTPPPDLPYEVGVDNVEDLMAEEFAKRMRTRSGSGGARSEGELDRDGQEGAWGDGEDLESLDSADLSSDL